MAKGASSIPRETINDFTNTLASFLSKEAKEQADIEAIKIIDMMKKYLKRIDKLRNHLNLQMKKIAYLNKKGLYSVLFAANPKGITEEQVNYNINETKIILSLGYAINQQIRQMITNQEIIYRILILEDKGAPIGVIETDKYNLFRKNVLFVNSSTQKFEDISLRLTKTQKEWYDNFNTNKGKLAETDVHQNKLSSKPWDERTKGLYRKFTELRTEMNIDPHNVTNGNLFEIADRIFLMRRHQGNEIVYWYSVEELKEMIHEKDRIESRKRADNYNIQNKAVKATITDLGQMERWAKDIVKTFEIFLNEGAEPFKQELIKNFTSDEQIPDDILGRMEKDLIEKNRENIKKLFPNLKVTKT